MIVAIEASDVSSAVVHFRKRNEIATVVPPYQPEELTCFRSAINEPPGRQ